MTTEWERALTMLFAIIQKYTAGDAYTVIYILQRTLIDNLMIDCTCHALVFSFVNAHAVTKIKSSNHDSDYVLIHSIYT